MFKKGKTSLPTKQIARITADIVSSVSILLLYGVFHCFEIRGDGKKSPIHIVKSPI